MENNLVNNRVIIGIILILSTPVFTMAVFSFVSSNTNSFTVIGFHELLKDVRLTEIGHICYRSLLISFISTFTSFILSYLLIIYTSRRFQFLFLIMIVLPFIANEAVRIFSWQNVLSDNGLFNQFLSSVLNKNVSVFSSAHEFNILTTMIITCIPFSIFICTGSLKTIPKVLWDVSNDLSIGHLSKFIRVGIPLSITAIVASIIITFFIAFSLSSEVIFLGGATKVSTRGFVLSLMSASRYEAIFAFGTVILSALFTIYFIFILFIKAKYKPQN